jgi:hypothetical protein
VHFERPIAGLIVIGLIATLVVGPAFVGVLSVILGGQPHGPNLPPTVPVPLVPILESGRVLLTLALAIKVMRTSELE